MLRSFGKHRTKKLMELMVALKSALNLAEFSHPNKKRFRCHELKGNRKGLLSLDLDHPYRLLVEPNHDPLPVKSDGGLDWNQVTAIKIRKIEDTHG